MISYYRVYYNSNAADITDTRYLFIYSSLPSLRFSQQGLCDFINQNPQNISFKCELSQDIWAIARIIPFKKEIRLPLDRECIFDLFMFITPIRNKIPSCVETVNIKTIIPLVVKSKIDQLDPQALLNLNQLVNPNAPSDETIIRQYQTNGLQYQQSGGNLWNHVTPVFADKTFESDFTTAPTANQTSKYLIIPISTDQSYIIPELLFLPDLRDQDYLQNTITKLDFYSLVNDTSQGYIVLDDGYLLIIIDCQDSSQFYVAMNQNEQVNAAVLDMTTLNNYLPTTTDPLDPYLSGVYIYPSGNSNVLSCISQIESFNSLDPSGNMYLISDYNITLLESTFSETIAGL